MPHKRYYQGFTLIEILVVVALIAILAAVTIIAINPAKAFKQARNAQRSSDVSQILNAMTQYTSEQGHSVDDFGTITACPATGSATMVIGTGAGALNLATTLVDEYIVAIPMDPQSTDPANTGYTVCRTAGGRLRVDAPNAEEITAGQPVVISVQR